MARSANSSNTSAEKHSAASKHPETQQSLTLDLSRRVSTARLFSALSDGLAGDALFILKKASPLRLGSSRPRSTYLIDASFKQQNVRSDAGNLKLFNSTVTLTLCLNLQRNSDRAATSQTVVVPTRRTCQECVVRSAQARKQRVRGEKTRRNW